ncbi:MAG TPA: ribosome maturation factor RimP [Cyanobacteria bacterium UBA9971]|nr:ribosome maturation factor RimP [Cyanobacteria bacterium UBA9971]
MNKENINKIEIIKKVTPVIEKAAEESGLILLEVDLVNEFNKWHLQVFIYNPKHPVTHEDCEKVTTKLDECLDLMIPVEYYLEVSSPGSERKLKSPGEYEIFRGKRVKIKLKKPINDNLKTFIGIISEYSKENGLKIKLEETNELIEIEETNISQIKLEPKYEF